MASLLNPISTRPTPKPDEVILTPATVPSASNSPQETPPPQPTTTSLETALEVLTSQPTQHTLNSCLKYLQLTTSTKSIDGSNILLPSPKTSPVVFALVNDIVPTFWPIFKDTDDADARKGRNALLRCLRSVAGVGAILARLRGETDVLRAGRKGGGGERKIEGIEVTNDFLEALLWGDEFLAKLWRVVFECETKPGRAEMLWREAVNVFAGGRVVGVVAEADGVLREKAEGLREPSWVGDGKLYAEWIGKNLRRMIDSLDLQDENQMKGVQQVLSKALTLGYPDPIITNAFNSLLFGQESSLPKTQAISRRMQNYDQKIVLYSTIRTLASQHLRGDGSLVGGVAAVISHLCENSPALQGHLKIWLVGSSPEAISQNHTTHRAVVLALCHELETAKSALWKALDFFSDKLFIKHSPLLHQEVNVQIMLLLAGHIHRVDKRFLSTVSKSSPYLSGISNHLAASSPKARFLGMIFGSTVSDVVDEPGKRLDFKAEDSDSAEWRWYKSLVNNKDCIGLISDLRPSTKSSSEVTSKPNKKGTSSNGISNAPSKRGRSSKIVKIEEIEDESESEDDLPTYGKPDSDPEDDDEDPTLVQRNKPTAPVYIRDLLAGLRDTENFDRHTLALNTAPSLIRRKVSFGTEVSDHIEDLASTIVGLKDRWELDDFTKLRLQAMLAILVAAPSRMGKWFSQSFYSGDYSLGQRSAILTALGLGAREIAGIGKDDSSITAATPSSESTFPSKRLPNKLHNHYALEAAPMNTLTTQLSRTMIQPLAAAAADKVTGPNALKVRTFSSRMEVEKKRSRPTSNSLAKVVADSFFFPLTGRWQVQTHALRDNAPQASPMLLSHLLKTLSLVLHAAGPSTLALPQMTAEFWGFLLSIRNKAEDRSVLEALLFALLTLLDVNVERQRGVAEENARELLETQEWVSNLLERMGGGDEEGERCKMLAAGVLVRCREVVEKYQRLMVGDLVDYM